MVDYPASRMKIMALRWLRDQYPDALLTAELAVAKYGEAMQPPSPIRESEKGTADA